MRYNGLELKIALPIRQQPDDVWQQLLAIAEKGSPATKEKFLEAIAELRDDLDVQAIEAAFNRGDIAAVVDAIPWDDLKDALHAMESSLDEVRTKAFDVSVGTVEPYLDPAQLAIHLGEGATLSVSFHHVSKDVQDAIARNTGARITAVTDETRAAVKQMIARAYDEGEHPRSLIPKLKQTIGLTTRQEAAVARYRASIDDGTRPAERVDRMVVRYQKKVLTGRADLIARTETMQAMNDGQRASWWTLVERGLLDVNGFEREWIAIVPTDGRTCLICESLDGERAPIGGEFPGGYLGAPAHPDCRCTEKIVPVEEKSRAGSGSLVTGLELALQMDRLLTALRAAV
jgi:hypothetical protein